MTSPDAFLKCSKFVFWVVRGRGHKGQKMIQNDKKKIISLRISGTVSHMIVVFGTPV